MEKRGRGKAVAYSGDTSDAIKKGLDAIIMNAAFLAVAGEQCHDDLETMQTLSEVIGKNTLAITSLTLRLQEVEDELGFRRELDDLGGNHG